MNEFLDHFWLFCGLWVGLGGALLGKSKSRKLIAANRITTHEASKYLKGWFICIFLPSFIFWVIQLSIPGNAGVDFLYWPNPQKALALTLTCGLWAALLVWVLFLGGAMPVSKSFLLVGNFPEMLLKPFATKILILIVVLTGVFSLVFRI